MKKHISDEIPTGVMDSWGLGGNNTMINNFYIYNNNPSFVCLKTMRLIIQLIGIINVVYALLRNYRINIKVPGNVMFFTTRL